MFGRKEGLNTVGSKLHDIILGGQDGLVNILGLVLGVAAATSETRIVIISGLAGTIAESVSMAAVAFTSTKAAKEYYLAERKREMMEIKEIPTEEKREVEQIYYKKGFRGHLLKKVVNKITSNKKEWLETMMDDELHIFPEKEKPLLSALIVGLSSFFGSLIPLAPFFLFDVKNAMIASLIFTAFILFVAGSIKGKITLNNWKKEGLELMVIGILSALAGYAVGLFLK